MRADVREQAALVALLDRPQVRGARLAVDVLERGSAVELLHELAASTDTLFPTPDAADSLIEEAAGRIAAWRADGIGVHSVLDETYPASLRDIHQMPPVLFTRGRLADDMRAIAVVGTRRPSERGARIAATVASMLVERQVTVVSGLALGIDTAAHRAALGAGGRTVAVIGTGVDRSYPPENRGLQERIAVDGLVISQFLPGTAPRREHFPMRNAVMSGYAAATVVVEAGERSGAQIQVRLALRHGRSVILLREVLERDWARRYADRPGVYVIDGPSDLTSVVEDVLRGPMSGELLSEESPGVVIR